MPEAGGPAAQPAVAIAVRGLRRGGAERLVFQEATAAKKAGLPVEVWYMVGGDFLVDLAEIDVPTHADPRHATDGPTSGGSSRPIPAS